MIDAIEPKEYSKRAVRLAVHSECGDRLVAIAKECGQLAHELMLYGRTMDELEQEIIATRLALLRAERDDIIRQYAEV
ncbi:hypothetical protein PAE9249_02797 [Paenibacillus sp. CECT 9249]|uniref:hypothetical protein n=1 Tax=Paenibacillus sp. CECT 9249 TaxID=2845385 RepID=UPI001E3E9BF8|nr:hypothetical protein [Paenibacillus sp. CECT 9249]CAH0120280.1 hypothetical protein PAE9249_02797 [Paenibacillus sp. CECT 9249]